MEKINFFEAELNVCTGDSFEVLYVQGYLPKHISPKKFLLSYYGGAILWVNVNPKQLYHYGGRLVNKEDNAILFSAYRANLWEKWSTGHSSARQPLYKE